MSENYVVGVDGSEHSRRALEWAVDEAARRGATVEAVLTWRFPVEDRPFSPTRDDLSGLEDGWTDTLDEVVNEVDASGLAEPIGRAMVSDTHAGRALATQAEGADLLVIGTRGRGGFLSLMLGSVAEYCLHHATCPTVFVPPHPLPESHRTVVGLDGSEASHAALRWSVDRASSIGGSVLALHAWNWIDLPKESQWDTDFDQGDAEEFADQAIAASDVDRSSLEVSVLNGLPSQLMIEAGAEAGLLVLGSHGQNRAEMLLAGSVANQVAHHTPIPLLIHR